MQKKNYISLSEVGGIHSQGFHQQVEMAAMIIEQLIRIIGTHYAKLTRLMESMASILRNTPLLSCDDKLSEEAFL